MKILNQITDEIHKKFDEFKTDGRQILENTAEKDIKTKKIKRVYQQASSGPLVETREQFEKDIEDLVQQHEESERERINTLTQEKPFANVLRDLNKRKNTYHKWKKEVDEKREAKEQKRETAKKSLNKSRRTFSTAAAGYTKWAIIWPFKKASEREVRQKGKTFLKVAAQVEYLKLEIYAYRRLSQLFSAIIQYIDTRLAQIKEHIHQLRTNSEDVAPVVEKSETSLKDSLGFQLDMDSFDFAQSLVAHHDKDLVKSKAVEIQDRLEEADTSGEKKVILENAATDLLSDNRGNVITVFTDKHEKPEQQKARLDRLQRKKAAPFLRLTDVLHDKGPLSTSRFAVPDLEGRRQLLKVIESSGENAGVHQYSDRILAVTTKHRIPAFAINGVDEWIKAAEQKDTYPLRNHQSLKSIHPSTTGDSVESMLCLGISGGIISEYQKGFFHVNGSKVHGFANVYEKINEDKDLKDSITTYWRDILEAEGIKGVRERFQALNPDRYSKKVKTLLNDKISTIEEAANSDITKDRFEQLLFNSKSKVL